MGGTRRPLSRLGIMCLARRCSGSRLRHYDDSAVSTFVAHESFITHSHGGRERTEARQEVQN